MSPIIDSWNQGARLWWSWCLHSTWQGLVLLVLVLAVLPLLRRASPHWRYALLFVALLKFLLPPLGMEGYGLFAWLFPPPPAVEVDFGPIDRFQYHILEIENYAAAAPSQAVKPQPPVHPLTPAGWGLVIHVLGSFALFVFLTVQVVRLRFRLKRAQWVTGGPLFNSVASVGQALVLCRIPRVYVSTETESPCAGGTWRKFFLLPGWGTYPNEPGQISKWLLMVWIQEVSTEERR